ncbi:1131_t:CDS:2, partial [Dentiscutata erythropus]
NNNNPENNQPNSETLDEDLPSENSESDRLDPNPQDFKSYYQPSTDFNF